MNQYHLKSHYKKILSDTYTPVSIYLKIRDLYPNSILLESSDYHANNNSFSYICCNPIASIQVTDNQMIQNFPDGTTTEKIIKNREDVTKEIHQFTQKFSSNLSEHFKFVHSGLFGYTCYDAVKYFEDIQIKTKDDSIKIPDLYYAVYQNIIAIHHYKNETHLFSHNYNSQSNIAELLNVIDSKPGAEFPFQRKSEIESNLTNEEYLDLVDLAKEHCAKGDVFQLVLSRRFSQKFTGDEFNVYRALRNINPSPYLFYFDYGNFKIFGSSPEAQLIVNKEKAEIHPIAGTFKRTGDDERDSELAKDLLNDEKESSEHIMLVDLARNDLSRHGENVKIESFREIQFFSHVIHLVSKVTAKKYKQTPTMQVVADTFPAGTLSGAPKHRAMQLIEKYEPTNRKFYGGAIGFMDFNGNFNHAIMIRTFLSQAHQLHWQAGAGLVSKSNPESELQEVFNKLGALTHALEIAETLYSKS